MLTPFISQRDPDTLNLQASPSENRGVTVRALSCFLADTEIRSNLLETLSV